MSEIVTDLGSPEGMADRIVRHRVIHLIEVKEEFWNSLYVVEFQECSGRSGIML